MLLEEGNSSTDFLLYILFSLKTFQKANHQLSLLLPIELAIMGISRDSRHKRSASGAKRAYYRAYNHT